MRSEARVCQHQEREDLEARAALRSPTGLRRETAKAPTRSEAACPSEILSPPGVSGVATIRKGRPCCRQRKRALHSSVGDLSASISKLITIIVVNEKGRPEVVPSCLFCRSFRCRGWQTHRCVCFDSYTRLPPLPIQTELVEPPSLLSASFDVRPYRSLALALALALVSNTELSLLESSRLSAGGKRPRDRDALRVAVRIRPLIAREKGTRVVACDGGDGRMVVVNPIKFKASADAVSFPKPGFYQPDRN